MRDDVVPARFLTELYGFNSFGDSANLVELDQNRISRIALNSLLNKSCVGHEKVITNDLYLLPKLFSHRCKA